MSGISLIPNEVIKYMFSFLELKDLIKTESVCQNWWQISISDNHSLWRDLFHRTFNSQPIEYKGIKSSFQIELSAYSIANLSTLAKEINFFYCNAPLETKQKWVCVFPQDPSSEIVIEQSLGCDQEKFEKSTVEEIKLCKYEGNISAHALEYGIFPPQDANVSHESLDVHQHSDLPYYRTLSIRSTKIAYNAIHVSLEECKAIPLKIDSVDVGFGNAFGYCSSINGWKEPFKLTCIQDQKNSLGFKWVGFLIPSEFKFVKIDKEGKIVWENYRGNRKIDLGQYAVQDLSECLEIVPISFN